MAEHLLVDHLLRAAHVQDRFKDRALDRPFSGPDGLPRNGRCPHMAVLVLSLLGLSHRLGSPQLKQHKRVVGRVIEHTLPSA